jgi:putative transcriptional regulator
MPTNTILEVVHETARGLRETGVMSTKTLREFDALCLPPVVAYDPECIKGIRLLIARVWKC